MAGAETRKHWGLVSGWITAAMLLQLATDWLYEVVFVFGSMAQLAWFALGGVLAIALLIQRIWRPALVLLAVGAGLLFSPLPQWGGWLWFRLSFEMHRPSYEAVLEDVATLPDSGEIRSMRYWIERGPPARIAFPQPTGVTDNWSAAVHDPSDAVLTARGWGVGGGGDVTVREDLESLWGGDLLSCTRITGHWHRCWFT